MREGFGSDVTFIYQRFCKLMFWIVRVKRLTSWNYVPHAAAAQVTDCTFKFERFRNNKTNQLQKKKRERNFPSTIQSRKEEKLFVLKTRASTKLTLSRARSLQFAKSFLSFSLANQYWYFFVYIRHRAINCGFQLFSLFWECKQKVHLWQRDREWHWSLSFARRLRSASYWTFGVLSIKIHRLVNCATVWRKVHKFIKRKLVKFSHFDLLSLTWKQKHNSRAKRNIGGGK